MLAILESLWLLEVHVQVIFQCFLGPIGHNISKKWNVLAVKGSVRIKEWIDKIELWAQVEFGTIYSYLIDTDWTYTKEKLQAYKNLEAYNYYSVMS